MQARIQSPHPKVLLFDLGGVIVDWVGMDALSDLTGRTRQDIVKTYTDNIVFQNYEAGLCETDIFLTEMRRVFELDITQDDMAQKWCHWVRPPFDGVLEALDKLRQNYTLACLSNTNLLHWQHLQTFLNTHRVFDYAFASHHIHAVKPAPESFLTPLRTMNVEASDVWFFDDTDINIAAAKRLGLTAFHINRSEGVLPKLKSLGLV